MSDGIDVEEFLQGFLGEADENLARITAALAAIERAPDRLHARELAELLRALHTLKGLAGMMGIDPLVRISHAMETRVRDYQRSEGRLPAGAIDPLLAGTRALVQRVGIVAARGVVPPPPESLMLALQRRNESAASSSASDHAALRERLPEDLREKLTASELAELAQAAAQGQRSACVRFAPSTAKAADEITITTVRAAIEKLGRIVRVVPRHVARGDATPAGLEFAMVVVTAAAIAALADVPGVGADGVESLLEPALATPDDIDVDDEELEPSRRSIVRVDVARLDAAVELLAAVVNGRSRLRARVAELAARGIDVRALASELDDETRRLRRLRGALVDLRMVPLREVLEPLGLLVRGLRGATAKDVALTLDVGDVELDKGVAERILPALIHMLRNAVDHGIEAPDTRRAAGKPERSVVTVRALASSTTHLDLEVVDDGAGIDVAAVEQRCGRSIADDHQLLEVLSAPGFSTRDTASTTSGRGVGLDIVRRTVESLGGQLELVNRRGHGVTWRLRVPLTVALVDAFACATGNARWLVPVSAVEAIVDVDEGTRIETPATNGGRSIGMLSTRGLLVPLVSLGEALGGDAREGDRKALLVQHGGQHCAFAVERMLGRHEVIVRPLVDPLVQSPTVAGSADLGDGLPTLVLDLRAIAHLVTRPAEVHA